MTEEELMQRIAAYNAQYGNVERLLNPQGNPVYSDRQPPTISSFLDFVGNTMNNDMQRFPDTNQDVFDLINRMKLNARKVRM